MNEIPHHTPLGECTSSCRRVGCPESDEKKCEDCLAHYTGEHTCPQWLNHLKRLKENPYDPSKESDFDRFVKENQECPMKGRGAQCAVGGVCIHKHPHAKI